MKSAQLVWIIGAWSLTLPSLMWPAWGQAGLKGEYYTGTNFDRKVFTRVDPAINFDWRDHNPGPNMPESYYSIRWTGKLLAPVTGEYKFSAKVDDGIRVWVGNKKVMESWQLNDSKGFSGSIVLEKDHVYDLRVDYFNDMLEGEIQLRWQRPDAKDQSLNPFSASGEPIAARYFLQKAPPVVPAPIPKPVAKPVVRTVTAVSTPPTTIPPKRPTVAIARPIPKPISSKPVRTDTIATNPTTSSPPTSQPALDMKPGGTYTLRNVQFEQSSYALLPESATELNQVLAALKKNPTWHIDIAGHTDNVGDPRLNQALSENRAKVVAHYLKQRGVADDRILAIGYGGSHPISDNATEGERSKNRRVEITIK